MVALELEAPTAAITAPPPAPSRRYSVLVGASSACALIDGRDHVVCAERQVASRDCCLCTRAA